MADLSVNIGELQMKNPVMTASGTFGYRSIFQVMVRHNRIITGLFNTKNSHLRTSFL